jgi:hypothetical protein
LIATRIAFASKNFKRPSYSRMTIFGQRNVEPASFGKFQKKFRTLPKGFSKLKKYNKKTHNANKAPPMWQRLISKASVLIAIYLLNLCLTTNLPKMEDQNSK